MDTYARRLAVPVMRGPAAMFGLWLLIAVIAFAWGFYAGRLNP